MNKISEEIQLFGKIFWLPMSLLFIFVVFMYLGGFEVIVWADSVFHFLGGVAVAFSSWKMINYWKGQGLYGKTTGWIDWFFIVCMTVLIALLWEFFEFSLDQLFGTVNQPSMVDTMKDLALGAIGAIIAGYFYVYSKVSGTK